MPRPTTGHRRSIRLRGYDYGHPGYYFVTICTAGQRCLFGHVVIDHVLLNAAGKIVEREWQRTETLRERVRLDEFIVMPNHLHGILHRLESGSPLAAIIGGFKSACTRQYRALVEDDRAALWQRSFFERVIRSETELARLRRYVAENPTRWAMRAG